VVALDVVQVRGEPQPRLGDGERLGRVARPVELLHDVPEPPRRR
jgi:hypothetical protein